MKTAVIMRRGLLMVGMLVMASLGYGLVSAHANLQRAEPPPNAILDAAPAEIRLWFTEPLEPQFSKINLRDKNGNIINLPPSRVDLNDAFQMVLLPGQLPDGLYTVAWRALSAADGHPSEGSYPIVIGDASLLSGRANETIDIVPPGGTFIRWFNLVSLALGVGGLGFLLFVWSPAVPQGNPTVEQRIMAVTWLGWLLIGASGFLLLLLQYSLATGNPLLVDINGASLNGVVANTRFGHLWLARMALWAGLGGSLWFARTDQWFYPVALVIGGAILAINSVFSHANAAYDLTASVAADWLHLTAMALWVGGLVCFVVVIGVVRRLLQPAAGTLSVLVGRFSNFARVSVASLIVTGLYSTWLQVGSLEGLLNTTYGQALLVKLILIVPVLGLAFINLVYTQRGLENGTELWGARLRGLVGAEIALTLGILVTVGVMTYTSPARNTLAVRAANPPAPAPQPIQNEQTANGLVVQMDITPGWVGENTFTLKLVDESGAPVNDATLIRMKFDSQTQNLGQSELRPTLTAEGVYRISGANLSVPGDWRIRTTIQRPNVFDTLVDFNPIIPAALPTPTPEKLPSASEPLPNRVLALIVAGVAALGVGGYFLGENRARLLQASSLLALGLMMVGGLFLFSAVQGVSTVSAKDALYAPRPQDPVRMAVNSNQPWPYLVTTSGSILKPDETGLWRTLPLNAHVNDIYVDMQKAVWAATDKGFFAYRDSQWEQVSDKPARRVVLTHGFLFALGEGNITRVPAGGGIEKDTVRELDVPQIDRAAEEFVMLGDHSHVLDNAGQLYHSYDLGLSWEVVNSAQSVDSISTDVDGNLIATTDNALLIWDTTRQTWGKALALPGGDPKAVLVPSADNLYAVGSGSLYMLKGEQWESISLPDSDRAHLTALAYQYPSTLWVLDAAGSRLWSSANGEQWTVVKVKRGSVDY